MSMHMCLCEFICITHMPVSMEARGCQIPDLERRWVVSHLLWVLGSWVLYKSSEWLQTLSNLSSYPPIICI